MNRPGDWNCRSCQHHNFQRRDACQRCGDPRPGEPAISFGSRVGSSFGFSTGPDVRPGDWYCSVGNCGTHNFASRTSCFNCGTFKETDFSRFAGRSGWKSGDWICTRLGCNEHNFASRMECFRCNAPKESTNTKSSFH